MGKVVGIDLGTTNSAIAYIEGGEPEIIANSEGNRITPSVVAFTEDGERLVGETAKRQAITNPDRTVSSIKRHMGTDHEVSIEGKQYKPQEISAMILQKLKRDAEEFLGEDVTEAVITVPAYFNEPQRRATQDAGKIAGLNVLRIINEPTAAALAYGFDDNQEKTILVYDLGGGTFDVSVLDIGDGVFEVVSTSGDNHLGGDDFDERIVDHIASEFKKEHGVDLRQDRMALQRLKDAAEKAKKELSSTVKTNINLPFITADNSGPKHLDMTLTRAKFEELVRDLVERTIDPVKQALSDAGMSSSDIDEILLVGGSTRIPLVQQRVQEVLDKEPHKGVNPDEVVALGAAVQAAALTGEMKDLLLLDVTPLSLGIETMGGVFTRLIERNTTIPTEASQIFSTAADNQTQVEIHVLQGEREMAADNETLGRFTLSGIPPAPRGVPQIEVTFKIDRNGILQVSAKDKATGKKADITIESTGALSDDEIDRMVKEAQEHEVEDKERRERIEVRNEADSLVYSSRRTLEDLGDNVDQADKEKVEEAASSLEEALEGEDLDLIKEKKEALQKALYDVSSSAYAKQSAGAGAGEAGGAAGGQSAAADSEDSEATYDAGYKVKDDE